jgi:co-chaperonin GroES (HSP10)
MSVPIQPLADYVVAQALEAQTKTASGLYLPGAGKAKSGQGCGCG